MTGKCMVAGAGILLLGLVVCAPAPADGAAQQPSQQPTYTIAEYNAYQAAASEKNPQQRVALLDDFVANFPKSTLLSYAYRTYYLTYYELKNYPKTVEYADRLLAEGDKLDTLARLEALTARTQAFFLGSSQKALGTPDQLNRARAAAADGLKVLGQWSKPDSMTPEQYAQQKKSLGILFNSIAGIASISSKDYKAAVDSFRAVLALDPSDALSTYRLGVAYLQQAPPQYMDGFWTVARSLALKVPAEAQVRDYLRKQLQRYQQTGCDKLLTDQMNELLNLAAASTDRPTTYKIPSAAELDAARQNMTIVSLIADLKGGGDRAKLVWLAACGLEFPDVPAKVIQATSGDANVTLKLFTGATSEEIEAGTTANLEVRIEGQPEAKRIKKDDLLRFTGTLVSYTPEPFLLHWEKAKVNPEDIPPEKPQPGKHPAKRPPAKRPAKKAGR